jgi:GATA-binding protein, other eukaryote
LKIRSSLFAHTNPSYIHSLAAQQAAQKSSSSATPSGIAQLRQATQSNNATSASASADFMNLDEFIVPSSIGSPAGIETLPATSDHNLASQSHSVAQSGIPIKTRKDQNVSQAPLVPASLPHPSQELRRNDEFGYVQRRVRKTSVDERKVSRLEGRTEEKILTLHRHLASDLQNSPLKSSLPPI